MKIKALVIEDDRGIVETISLAFQLYWPEAQLISTHLGGEGIELSRSEAPDVVILDLGLPDINGFEVLKQLRLFTTIPIIILTVIADEDDIVKALEDEASDYMIKPFRQMELLARIKAHVTQWRANKIKASFV